MDIELMRAELKDDIDTCIGLLVGAVDAGERRRAVRLSLSTLYVWRNLERGLKRLGGFRGWSDEGDRLEHLIALRGLMEHEFVVDHPVAVHGLMPGAILPSDATVPGVQPHIASDVDVSQWAPEKQQAYNALKGQPIAQLVHAGGDFLASLA